jgi:hypothetical protein
MSGKPHKENKFFYTPPSIKFEYVVRVKCATYIYVFTFECVSIMFGSDYTAVLLACCALRKPSLCCGKRKMEYCTCNCRKEGVMISCFVDYIPISQSISPYSPHLPIHVNLFQFK